MSYKIIASDLFLTKAFRPLQKDVASKFVSVLFDSNEGSAFSKNLQAHQSLDRLEEKEIFKIGDGCSIEEFFNTVKEIIKRSANVYHPAYLNQIYSYGQESGILGAWLSDYLKNSIAAFQSAPVGTILERAVINHLCKLVGYDCDWNSYGNGALVPSGTESNKIGIMVALRKHFRVGLLQFMEEEQYKNLVDDGSGQYATLVYAHLNDIEGRLNPLMSKIKKIDVDGNNVTVTLDCDSKGTITLQIPRVGNDATVKYEVENSSGEKTIRKTDINRLFEINKALYKGYDRRNLVILCTKQTHFSVSQAANQIGLGVRSIVRVNSDSAGRMDVESLKEMIDKLEAQGKKIVCVVNSLGVVITGAIDPIAEVAQVCKEKGNIHLHIDGCIGGPLLYLEKEFKHLKKAVKEADTITLDGHKGFGTKLTVGVLLTKESGLLTRSLITHDTQYLFHNDPNNLGMTGVGAAKEASSIGFALNLKRLGERGMKDLVQKQLTNTRYFWRKLKELSKVCPIYMVNYGQKDPDSIIATFRFGTKDNDERDLNQRIQQHLYKGGKALISYSTENQFGFVFRPCFSNPKIEESHIDELIKHLKKAYNDIKNEDFTRTRQSNSKLRSKL